MTLQESPQGSEAKGLDCNIIQIQWPAETYLLPSMRNTSTYRIHASLLSSFQALQHRDCKVLLC